MFAIAKFIARAETTNNTADSSLIFQEISLAALMDSLEQYYSFHFAYDLGIIDVDSVINVNIDLPLDEKKLEKLFGKEGVGVKLFGNQVIIARERGLPKNAKLIRISGRVEGLISGEPLAMATIGVLGTAVGTITNDVGYFDFLLAQEYAGNKLFFSYLGHLSNEILIPETDTVIIVRLPATSIELPEVNVLYRNPDEIVNELVSKINENYLQYPSFLTAFFRETIQQDEKFVDVSEAVIEILKPSYKYPSDSERVRFIKGRKGRETADMEFINFKLVGGPYHFSRLDIVRNGDFLPKEQNTYRYSFEGVTIDFNKILYRIAFKPVKDNEGLFYKGEMRIDSESYALVSIEFELTPASIKRSRNYLIQRDARKFRSRPVFARYKVEYRPFNNKWMLSRVVGVVNLQITDKNSKQQSVFNAVSEMFVSDLTEAAGRERIKWAETFKPSYVLSEHLGEFDPQFWKDYNIIQADEALEKVFRKK